jgi:hypothetical protein
VREMAKRIKRIIGAKQTASAILRFYRGDSNRWTKRVIARPSKRSRTSVEQDAKEARCWCLVGALHRTNGDCEAFFHKVYEITGQNPAAFNDEKTTRFSHVQRLLREIVASS